MNTNRNKYIGIITLVVAVIIIVITISNNSNNASKVVPVQPAGQNLSQVYSSTAPGFSIKYPAGFTVDDTYTYQELGPGKDISGVKFTIPASLSVGTNLSTDSYISVEEIPQAQTCDATLFLDQARAAQNVTDGGTTYSFATSNGAGAGNRYDETIYAISGTTPCLAVRYFIHYSVFENYPQGTIKHFDEQALINQFDTIRRTLIVSQ